MKLPNAKHAVIDRRKLIDYVFNTNHDEGKHKARLFRDLLGLSLGQADVLDQALREAVVKYGATAGRSDRYGRRYTVDFPLTGPKGTKTVRSAWIIPQGKIVPELVTCYII